MPGGRVGGGGHASGGGGGRIGGGFGGSSRGGSFGSRGTSYGGGSRGNFYPSPGSRPVRDYAPRNNQRYNVPKSVWSQPRTSRPVYSGPIIIHSTRPAAPAAGNASAPVSGHSSSAPASGGSSGIGCTILLLIAFVLGMMMLFSGVLGGGTSGTSSTVHREPLASGSVKETGYYEDQIGLINSSSTLQNGMRAFYQQTGVQPYLYVTDSINGDYAPSNTVLDAYAEELYDELFEDGGHFLVILYDVDRDGFGYYYELGDASKSVLDNEAIGIFESYLNSDFNTYYDSPAAYFSTVFSHTADRIMQVTRGASFYMGIGLVVLAILGLLYYWWKRAKEQKNKEAAHMEAVLNADIEELAKDPTLADLEQKYADDPEPK